MFSRSDTLTIVLLFSGMALFGSATPLSKMVVDRLPVFTASLVRVAVGALFVLPFLGRGIGRIRSLTRRDWFAVGAIALVGMFGFTVLLLYGMRLVPGVVGAIVMSTAPAVTATASVLFLSDRWSRNKIVAILLSVAGVVVVNTAGSIGNSASGGELDAGGLVVGTAFVFGAVCCEAGYTLIGKVATKRLDPVLTVFLASALAVPLFLIPASILDLREFDLRSVGPSDWAAVLVWGAGTLGLGSILWYKGVQRAEGTIAAGFMGVMPVSALVFSYVLLSEPVVAAHLAGFAVVFAGVVLISREHASGGESGH
jgi:drug/metabolite transporter (DMT)-like permease